MAHATHPRAAADAVGGEKRCIAVRDQDVVDAADGASFPVQNPHDGSKLADVARAGEADVDRAVAAARRPAAHRQADSRFHLTIAALTESPRVIEAVTSVQSTLHEMLLAIPVLEANIAHSDRQHAALVRAILKGRPDRARAVMEQHCDDTAALLRGLVA